MPLHTKSPHTDLHSLVPALRSLREGTNWTVEFVTTSIATAGHRVNKRLCSVWMIRAGDWHETPSPYNGRVVNQTYQIKEHAILSNPSSNPAEVPNTASECGDIEPSW